MAADQTDTFRFDEGDNWFRRNESALDPSRRDHVIDMVLRANERFNIRSARKWLAKHGDPLAPVLTTSSDMFAALESLARRLAG